MVRHPAAYHAKVKILLVEDDHETAQYIVHALAGDGHAVSVAADGRIGLARATDEHWDLLIVDRLLPHLDGLELVRALRKEQVGTAVLFLTTLGGIDDRVNGLNAGADDYLTKPFALSELAARVAALGRRPRTGVGQVRLCVGNVEVDSLARTARRGNDHINLAPREFRLMEYLMKHEGHIVTRAMLLENVWDLHFEPHTNVVETHISRLRAKLDRVGATTLIQTVRGTGYCLRALA